MTTSSERRGRFARRASRRGQLPDEVRASPPLQRRERVLARAPLHPEGHAVATTDALLLPAAGGWERLEWWRITSATWDGETERLVIEGTGPDGSLVRRLPLAGDSSLPEAVRERVQASIVLSRHVPIAGRAGVRFVARRVPGVDELLWQVLPDRALRMDDQAVRDAVDAALRDLRARTTS